jgi:hypothetical protein
MFGRNLLLLALVGFGSLAFVASLFPTAAPTQWEGADLRAASLRRDGSFQRTLAAVNELFRSRWSELKMTPAPRADDLTVMRRISLALTGTIPSLEEIRMFQRRRVDRRPDDASDFPSTDWWTAGLLEDRRAHDYLAERFARAFVGTEGGPFLIYRRRRFVSWLTDELRENRPYDQVVSQLITANGLWTSEPATNFITAHITPGDEGKPDETKLAARVYRAFLGVRIDCAQCHDHPFESWTQEDFHNLAAFFGRTENFLGIRDGKREYKWVKHVPSGKAKPAPMEDDDEQADATPPLGKMKKKDPKERIGQLAAPFFDELLPPRGGHRERLATWVTHEQNKAFGRATVNRIWALMFGRGLVEPVDDMPLLVPDSAEDANYLSMRVLDILADDFAQHNFDLRRLIQLVAATEVFQLDSTEDPAWTDEQLEARLENWALFRMTRLRPEQVAGAILQASSVQTIDHESHIIWRLNRFFGENEFVERYGDAGEDELLPRSGTMPQRLLMLNGELVKDKTSPNPLTNAATQIALLAPDDKTAIESMYLVVQTRMPTEEEVQAFTARLKGIQGDKRQRVLEDLFATLFNLTDFSWNH